MKKLTTHELVLVASMSVALGLFFFGWTFFYEITKPFLKAIGMKYLISGFWMISAVLPMFIVRKPGVAIFGSLVASLVEGFISGWGVMALVWGLVQGIGAEIIFFFFKYRMKNFVIPILASVAASVFSYAIDFHYYGYKNLSTNLNLMQLGSFIFSSVFLSGVLTIYLAKKLMKTGLLINFEIANENNSK